jgi:hypothetical protein
MGELRNSEERAKAQIDMLIQCELAYMNTSHPDFIGFQAYVDAVVYAFGDVFQCICFGSHGSAGRWS